MSAEQYQLTQMQFELPSLWRGIEEQDSARIPDAEAMPASTQQSEIVMVALPFSSLQLNPSLAAYLGLTSSQIEAIQQVMTREQRDLEPLMTTLRTTREKLVGIDSEHVNEKQVKSVADTEAKFAGKTDRRKRPHAIPNLQASQPGTAKEAERSRTNARRSHIG
jgi:hypothetical protein